MASPWKALPRFPLLIKCCPPALCDMSKCRILGSLSLKFLHDMYIQNLGGNHLVLDLNKCTRPSSCRQYQSVWRTMQTFVMLGKEELVTEDVSSFPFLTLPWEREKNYILYRCIRWFLTETYGGIFDGPKPTRHEKYKILFQSKAQDMTHLSWTLKKSSWHLTLQPLDGMSLFHTVLM